ncbi:MAG: CBS domain-containing protein [Candidatus Hydrothermarchaeales archaeon]
MKPKVKNYMSSKVITVKPEQTLDEVLKLVRESSHDGFPVVEDGRLVGIITIRDMVFKKRKTVEHSMSGEVVVTFPDTNLTDAARVMFRMGYSRLPVVDKDRMLIGIITNADVIRSHIERATPDKVRKISESLEKLYTVKTIVRMGKVKIKDLMPTQGKIHPDEFRGREYEMKRGLAEPIVVLKSGDKTLLVDGHHRALAARKLGIGELKAYIIVPSKNIEFGLEKTAKAIGLNSIEDMKLSDYDEGTIAEIIK